jgi:hypothetical protein
MVWSERTNKQTAPRGIIVLGELEKATWTISINCDQNWAGNFMANRILLTSFLRLLNWLNALFWALFCFGFWSITYIFMMNNNQESMLLEVWRSYWNA